MTLGSEVFVALHLTSATLMVLLATVLVVRSRSSGERWLAASLIAAGWWALCNALGWIQAGYVGVVSVVPLLAIFVARQTRPHEQLSARFVAAVAGIPALCLFIIEVPGLQVAYFGWWGGTFHPVYLLLLGHVYASILWLGYRLIQARRFWLLLGIVPPILVDILNRLWPELLGISQPQPLAFSLAGLIFFWGVYRFRVGKVTPLAREQLFETLSDGILVLDAQQRVVDDNAAARSLELPRDALQTDYPAFLHDLRQFGHQKVETRQVSGRSGIRHFELEGLQLKDPSGSVLGYLVQFHDIHDRKTAELEQRDQRQVAEALAEIALSITTIPDAERVLDKVAEACFRVFDCTASIILECRDDGRLTLGAARGHLNPQLGQWLEDGTLNWQTTPTFATILGTGNPLLIPNTRRSSEWVQLDPYIASWVAAPIQILGTTLGFLRLDHEIPEHFTPLHAQRLKAFADLTAIVIQNARAYRAREKLATTDPHTGHLNRGAFFQRAEEEFARAKRLETPLSMLLVNLDHFRAINDAQGHREADRILFNTAIAIRGCLKELDLVGRWDGDEFVILLPETDILGARDSAQRLHRALQAGEISVSIGVSCLLTTHHRVEDLLHSTSLALTRAKDGGRNRVV